MCEVTREGKKLIHKRKCKISLIVRIMKENRLKWFEYFIRKEGLESIGTIDLMKVVMEIIICKIRREKKDRK